MNQTKKWQYVTAFAVAVALAACSGDSFESGQTMVTGNIILPEADRCLGGCTTSNVQVMTFQPAPNPPTAPPSSTSATGVYNTGDITGFVDGLAGGDQQTIIALAVVANADAPPEEQTQIGGLLPGLTRGSVTSKDFNPTTHIACLAGVFLTGQAGQPCPQLLQFIDANQIDEDRTNVLEQASSQIQGDVVFPTEVPCSACAVIQCTNSGLNLPASPACIPEAFAACLTVQR